MKRYVIIFLIVSSITVAIALLLAGKIATLSTYKTSLMITALVISLQITVYIEILSELSNYRKLLPSDLLGSRNVIDHDDDVKLISLGEYNIGSFFSNLVDNLNNYFKKNKGVVDFEIINGIIERKVSTEEESASSRIGLPIYIGLMGTVLGIIFGMFSMAASNDLMEQENVKQLIGGVIIAMIATFTGILLTALANFVTFKKAKSVVERNKNEFLNFLQTELLPHLQSSLHQTLNILGINVEKFNETFKKNIDAFDKQFAGSITNLKEAVNSLSSGMDKIVENTKMQKLFIEELKGLDFLNLAKSNKDLLNRLKHTTPILNSFISNQEKLNQTIQNTERFVQKIDDLLNRITTFEESINRLGENINTNEFLGNEVLIRIDKNLKYLNLQSELLIQQSNDTTNELKDHLKAEIKKIQILTQTIQSEIEKALDFNIERNPLLKLNNLDEIKGSLENLNGMFSTNGESTSEIALAIKSLNSLSPTYDKIAKELEAISNSIRNIDSKALTSQSLEDVIKRHKNGETDTGGFLGSIFGRR